MSSVAPRDLAVLLNGNARRVNKKVKDAFTGLISPDDLFYSANLRDSRTIARTVVDKKYRTILTGGGDGTFATFLTHIYTYMQQAGITDYSPRFGVLKLGTGNAMAATFGASTVNRENLASELYYAANGASTKDLRLIEVEGKRTPFTGLGMDAMILNDYIAVKEMMSGTPLQQTSKGILGYGIGLMTMSIPRYFMQKPPEAVIVNEGEEMWRIDGNGKRRGPIFRKGDVIYKGPVKMISASKVPYYGFEFKLFPFAMINNNKFHLRVHNASGLEALGYLPTIWKGNYSSETVFDFLADNIAVYLSSPAPFQIGGDGEGWRSYAKFSLCDNPIPIIDFKSNTH
ncbi:MAG: diacylglycerol kinase family protein [Pseudomonadota bacterium]